MYVGLHVKYPSFLQDFDHLNFVDRFTIIFKYRMSWEAIQWESRCSIRMDGRTDRDIKLTVDFRNLAKAPETRQICSTTLFVITLSTFFMVQLWCYTSHLPAWYLWTERYIKGFIFSQVNSVYCFCNFTLETCVASRFGYADFYLL